MDDLIPLVKSGLALVATGDRTDLRLRLEQTLGRLANPDIRVIVVGEFKQGKSKLINALVNAPVCPVDDDIATSVPTVVSFGDPASAAVVMPRTDGDAVERRDVALEDIAGYVSERGNPSNRQGLASAEVRLPRRLLADGLSVIDSPGVGGLESAHALTTLTALPTADAMLLVSDASQEYTEPELRFLKQATRIVPNVGCVLSKTDLYPQWRTVADLDRGHLSGAGITAPLIPVSSDLRLFATQAKDVELNRESGFPELIGYLRNEVVGKAQSLRRTSVAQDLLSTADHLRLSVTTELQALENPDGVPLLLADLEEARERADQQRKRSSRWQTTLNDGATDLISDMEHDLRERLRSIQREAEAAIDDGDPGPVWDQFAEWLEQRVASAVSDTFVWTSERSQWLAEQVAELFALDEVPLPLLEVSSTDGVLAPVEEVPFLDPGRVSAAGKVLIGMRGSYGGVLMFGLLTGIIGMSLINPLSVGAGLLLGRKAYREDKEARLKRRQAEAKSLVRRQMDDVVFQVGKQLKDRLRLVQREIRDHFGAIAEEHHRSLADSVAAAQRTASTFRQEREARITELKGQLAAIDRLRAQAARLVPKPAQPAQSAAPAQSAQPDGAPDATPTGAVQAKA
ncbi:Isoniazid-inducible protein iniA [Arthrobacter pityocampae]|uniref:Isoniazid-inducible protein iniA n=1 Tax=Arthrobacter pityocampae TaxID=547334 RepID=A0A2S5IYN6_9MICC|nr:dynamin family protein [Arthrobacter pityocampae]PPB49600.1 Isoniazid-inducible protein iniA [Arthrobacter pityocampae]